MGESLGEVGSHWCGLSPLRCLARGLRVPFGCCCEHLSLFPGRRPSERHPDLVGCAGSGQVGSEW